MVKTVLRSYYCWDPWVCLTLDGNSMFWPFFIWNICSYIWYLLSFEGNWVAKVRLLYTSISFCVYFHFLGSKWIMVLSWYCVFDIMTMCRFESLHGAICALGYVVAQCRTGRPDVSSIADSILVILEFALLRKLHLLFLLHRYTSIMLMEKLRLLFKE